MLPCETTIHHRPNSVPEPYPELTLFKDGLRCSKEAGCSYICRTENTMKEHLRKRHQGTLRTRSGRPPKNEGSEGIEQRRPWRPVACQRLFPSGLGSTYFEVQAPNHRPSQGEASDLGTSRPQSFWDAFEADFQRYKRGRGRIITAPVPGDISPWQQRVGWNRFLQGLDRYKLKASMNEPGVGECLIEAKIWRGVQSLIQTCEDTVCKSNISVRIQILQKDPTDKVKQPIEPYLQLKELREASRQWQQIFLFFVRVVRSQSWEGPAITLNENQRSLLQDVWQKAQDAVDDSAASDALSGRDSGLIRSPSQSASREMIPLSELELSCLRFSISLLDQQVRTHEYYVPLIAAMAVLGIDLETGWKGLGNYPRILSDVIQVSRYMVVQYAVEQVSEETQCGGPRTMIDFTEEMVKRFMMRRTYSPIEWMLALRDYGLKLAIPYRAAGLL